MYLSKNNLTDAKFLFTGNTHQSNYCKIQLNLRMGYKSRNLQLPEVYYGCN